MSEAARRFTNQVRDLHGEPEILGAVEEAARVPLALESARVVPTGDLPWPRGIVEGEITEAGYRDPVSKLLPVKNVEMLVPITSGGSVTHSSWPCRSMMVQRLSLPRELHVKQMRVWFLRREASRRFERMAARLRRSRLMIWRGRFAPSSSAT